MKILSPMHRYPQDAPQSGSPEETVQQAFDFATLLLWCIGGAFVAFIAVIFVTSVFRRILRKWPVGSALLKRMRTPMWWSFMAWGSWVGLQLALRDADLSEWSNGPLVATISHLILILAIAAVTWTVYSAAWVFEDAARLRANSDGGHSRRFETQAQVIRRLTQLVIFIVGTVTILSTFEAARQTMTTLLASAGLISVIAGLAAQQTLGNVFAGIQLAFTDAIRVGDVVVANAAGESGAIEEITLSYVVVRLWDERRLIVPSTYFTSTTFENWTRRAARQLGTVSIKLDWAAPMTLIRAKVEQILSATDLWDGRTWAVQMTDSDDTTVTVRILVSGKNSGALWDLRCHLREELISWIVNEEPWARPTQRFQRQETISVDKDSSRERMAALAAELSGIAADETYVPKSVLDAQAISDITGKNSAPQSDDLENSSSQSDDKTMDAVHAARLIAARRKAKRARRRAMADRQRDLAQGNTSREDDAPETQVMSKTTLQRILEAASSRKTGAVTDELTETRTDLRVTETELVETSGRGARLFSGSPEAEERSEMYAGPGDDVLAEREAAARRRSAQARKHTDPDATQHSEK